MVDSGTLATAVAVGVAAAGGLVLAPGAAASVAAAAAAAFVVSSLTQEDQMLADNENPDMGGQDEDGDDGEVT